ncbi:MAG: MBOAT family protein [Proteobacteria bacterium]|nr:MBOAT family protein [Pseudomonadota bacterium]
MLFNSYGFIFLFLPAVLAGYFLIGARVQGRAAIAWLVAASLFFYGWWNPAFLPLILFSVGFNFVLGMRLLLGGGARARKAMLILGIAGNLGLLAYFKYANFLVGNLEAVSGGTLDWPPVVLPIAISFFTFQQIAYLVDVYRGEAQEYRFLNYVLFVTFFPQLIAGPIVHHRETLPQFARKRIGRFDARDLSIGSTIFFIGLFKTVVIADNLANFATPVFGAADSGLPVTFAEAWGAALAYTFQLYFDFSGYSDMAIGLGRMFGIRLPVNFNSPYKAASIIDFWRRWHITLSRFLRTYLYFALGGNRRGSARRYANLMTTMLLGGLWHGAGWGFVIWGGLHGVYLLVNHGWRRWRGVGTGPGLGPLQTPSPTSSPWRRRGSVLLTFFAVVVAWVFFRAETLGGAWALVQAMVGLRGFSPPAGSGFLEPGIWLALAALFAVVTAFPNTQEIMGRYRPALGVQPRTRRNAPLTWRPTRPWGVAVAIVALVALAYVSGTTEFLYFRF